MSCPAMSCPAMSSPTMSSPTMSSPTMSSATVRAQPAHNLRILIPPKSVAISNIVLRPIVFTALFTKDEIATFQAIEAKLNVYPHDAGCDGLFWSTKTEIACHTVVIEDLPCRGEDGCYHRVHFIFRGLMFDQPKTGLTAGCKLMVRLESPGMTRSSSLEGGGGIGPKTTLWSGTCIFSHSFTDTICVLHSLPDDKSDTTLAEIMPFNDEETEIWENILKQPVYDWLAEEPVAIIPSQPGR
ncbi:hypothetical protein B0T17DRAFT_371054 [Bombardia bombarda]|uniref:Uncharacterized protein n=1 Tax=Bombardia bombarda TaxID=252184 RepID=A0AA39WGB4_9PEZI|nr:hypothetical protein B0T17DRAFT_371054 [Bombardia bombarda]